MRAHIHCDRHGWPQSVNNYLAMDGLQQMGWELVPYTDAEPAQSLAEWRCFVRYGRILDARPYKGD